LSNPQDNMTDPLSYDPIVGSHMATPTLSLEPCFILNDFPD